MGWVLVIAMAAAAFGLLVLVLKAPRRSWEALAAALIFGLAGFALQGRPDLAGAPKIPAQKVSQGGAALVEARRQLSGGGPIAGNRLMIVADGFSRDGEYALASELLLGVVDKEPRNTEAWLALANNLMAHAEGVLTPAAQYAFGKAAQADPAHPGPSFFLGLALAQNGDLAAGRAQWAGLLERSPPDAPWRKDLEARLAELDTFIAKQQPAPPPQQR